MGVEVLFFGGWVVAEGEAAEGEAAEGEAALAPTVRGWIVVAVRFPA